MATRKSPPGTRRKARGKTPPAGARRAAAAARQAQAQLAQGAQQVWLAGMGAVARAQKDGPAAFQDAVNEGLKLLGQSRSTARRMVRDAFGTAQETLQSRVGGAREQAQETWDNLEALFQSRVQRAMHQLGVPTADEIRALTRRVAELNESVSAIGTRGGARKTPRGKGTRRAKRGKTAR
jgi:poly(hydroxyalkanoate) granule-associated protein